VNLSTQRHTTRRNQELGKKYGTLEEKNQKKGGCQGPSTAPTESGTRTAGVFKNTAENKEHQKKQE
jgi:hypothetical protein